MNDLKKIHIGEAIERRRRELDMTKTELARRIGIPQQHIKLLTSKDYIRTNQLIEVCKALDFNFFALYCNASTDMSFIVEKDKEAEELAKMKDRLQTKTEECNLLRERLQDYKGFVVNIKNQLKDKDYIIELLEKKIKSLTSKSPKADQDAAEETPA